MTARASMVKAITLASLVCAAACSDSGDTTGAGGSGTSSAKSVTSQSATSATSTGTSASGTTSNASSTGSGGPIGCLTDVSAGHHKAMCAGNVSYDVEIPAACVSGGCGLVVDIHGYTMTGDSEDKNTGMRALGQANGYVIVQPTAPADGLGQPSWDQATHVPLVYAFLADLATSLAIDPAKIHAMGFSQGGGMTFRLLCTHADFFASGAPAGALPGCEFTGANKPSEEVDILQVHGHVDGVVNFNANAIPQRDAVLNGGWSFGAPAPVESDPKHTATRWTTNQGTVFEFWEHDYKTSASAFLVPLQGHCVPGGQDFSGFPAGYSCEDMGTFVFGALAMQFFVAHPK